MRIQIALCLALAACLVTGACTYIGETEYQNRILQMDNDGDGYALDGKGDNEGVDCDDTDPEINPGAEEIWYDGINQNCDKQHDYDQDDDGYYANVEGDRAPDCDDTNNEIHPGADDDWYDGTDSDCAGNDDYDQDGDTHCPLGMDADAGRLCEDCNDTDAFIFLGAPDAWYDGIDSDCKGDDDFDADLDGQCHVDYTAAAGRACEDCNDNDDDIYTDCGGENLDFDQDGDGFDCDDDPSVSGDCDGHSGTDCDDTDPTTYQGALEQLGDAVDHDCEDRKSVV
jgi:hypothetical protein